MGPAGHTPYNHARTKAAVDQSECRSFSLLAAVHWHGMPRDRCDVERPTSVCPTAATVTPAFLLRTAQRPLECSTHGIRRLSQQNRSEFHEAFPVHLSGPGIRDRRLEEDRPEYEKGCGGENAGRLEEMD